MKLQGSRVQREGPRTTAAGGASASSATGREYSSRARPLTPAEKLAYKRGLCVSGGACAIGAGRNITAVFTPAEPAAALPAAPAAAAQPGRTITIEDVARFVPADTVLHTEPDGWAVVGVPANFWVEVDPVVVDGELLGDAAQVRFTPVGYRWDHGDGTTLTTDTPGASWADLGQDELTRTATSHEYAERGRPEPSVTVLYSAAYRIGDDDWVQIDGTVEAATPPVPLLVVRERTVLTNGDPDL